MPDKRIILHNPERHPHYFINQPMGMPVGWCNHNKHHNQNKQAKKEKKHKAKLEEYMKEEIRASLDKILPNLYNRNR